MKASEQLDGASVSGEAGGSGRTERVVVFDGGCGVCTRIVAALARRDRDARLRFVATAEAAAWLDDAITSELFEATLVAIDPATGRHWVRSAALAEIARRLPGGQPIAWLLAIPGLRRVADAFYDAFARRRSRISRWLGLTACEVPSRPARRDGD